ncbi:MAG: DNA-protecting protein DprA [Desulfovibrionaceae bacterium]|nr:DNA-protecting protein DprA [Desulfovibrionaceae bacterium]MBF0513233.1 DNA-protecting protein DprA [Desulfovibrionaceae bacterium]
MKKSRQAAKALDLDRELWAVLALRHTPGVGPRILKKILSGYSSAYDAVTAAAHWPSRRLASKDAAAAFISRVWQEGAVQEHGQAVKAGMSFLPCTAPAYPARLRELPDPPAVLYYRGDARLLEGPGLAVVGSRQASRQGLAAARTIASGFSRAGICVVSGLALGIDRAAHLGALTGPGSSIAVLGTGLDVVYPPRNRDLILALAEQGLIVSEFAPGAPPLPQHFPVRNRIIAGLSLAVVVVEAPEKSGSLITARLAMEQGAEVFAVPGAFDTAGHKGCHALINQGARLFESVERALLELSPLLGQYAARPQRPAPAAATGGPPLEGPDAPDSPGAGPPNDLSELEAAVWTGLSRDEPRHIDAVGRELGVGSAAISRALLGLEVRGLVRKRPGMYYTKS